MHKLPTKRKYFPKKGFICRTQLAVLAYNENRMAEMSGDRRVSADQSFSEAKGEKVTKRKKGPASEEWKKFIVDKAIER
jgi:hypothetical protein